MWTDNDGIERECPHDKYGDRIPTYEDVTALAKVVDTIRSSGTNDNLDAALQMISVVLASYCRQFRDVAGPEKGG